MVSRGVGRLGSRPGITLFRLDRGPPPQASFGVPCLFAQPVSWKSLRPALEYLTCLGSVDPFKNCYCAHGAEIVTQWSARRFQGSEHCLDSPSLFCRRI